MALKRNRDRPRHNSQYKHYLSRGVRQCFLQLGSRQCNNFHSRSRSMAVLRKFYDGEMRACLKVWFYLKDGL